MGILTLEPEQWFRLAKPGQYTLPADAGFITGSDEPTGLSTLSDAEIEELIAARIAARQAKDFKESDRIRDLLAAAGVIVEDKPGRSTWRRA